MRRPTGTAQDDTFSDLAADLAYDDGFGGTARLRIEEVGACLVAATGGVYASAAKAIARAMPPEDDRISVVVPRLTPALVPELVDGLRAWVPIRWESVRLVAAAAVPRRQDRAAETIPAPVGPGVDSTAGLVVTGATTRSMAQELADALGVEVLAPDGNIVCVPGGSLFVSGASATGLDLGTRGSWWRLRPGRDPQQVGRRFPEPVWERHLDAMPASQFGHLRGVVVEEVPCGLWVRRPGPVRAHDLVYAIPVQSTTAALVVSRPGDQPLGAAEIRQLIVDLPAPLREHIVLVPYGDDPVEDARLGAIGSEAANQTLRVRTGLPLQLVGEGRHVVAVSRTGTLGWRPFAVELAWRPYGGARVHSWIAPGEALLPLGPAQLALNDRWMVEVVEAGLWIRAIDRLDGAAMVRELPVESDYCTVVIGAPDSGQQHPPWRAITRLLRDLPSHARTRIRLAVAEEASNRLARPASRIQSRLAGGHAWLLCEGGRSGARLVPLSESAPAPFYDDDDTVMFRAATDDRSETARLLSFVDELRRTPAWDEEGADPGPTGRESPGRSRPSVGRPAEPDHDHSPASPPARAAATVPPLAGGPSLMVPPLAGGPSPMAVSEQVVRGSERRDQEPPPGPQAERRVDRPSRPPGSAPHQRPHYPPR